MTKANGRYHSIIPAVNIVYHYEKLNLTTIIMLNLDLSILNSLFSSLMIPNNVVFNYFWF